MPVISLWQPFASLCFTDDKDHETRGWAFPERLLGQRILIHAAKRLDMPKRESILCQICATQFGGNFANTLPRGAILGSVILEVCLQPSGGAPSYAEFFTGDWTKGRFAWKLAEKRLFDEPIPAVGRQRWWSYDLPEKLAA